jgi:dCTP deaminase
MIVPPQEIERLSGPYIPYCNRLIYPFSYKTVYKGFTYGLAECGYDIRIDQDVSLYPTNLRNVLLNSMGIIRPSFVLASSIEKFNIPKDMAAVVLDKSSWARRGLALQNTILEPNWYGFVTIECSLHGNKPLHIKKGTPIAQVVFHRLEEETKYPYEGKYQNQERGPQKAR